MRHKIEDIAESRFLDLAITQKVAKEYEGRFRIHEGAISTLYVNDFVDKIREVQGSQTSAIRLREIEKMKVKMNGSE